MRLRLDLNHPRENKFRHNFQNSLDPICSCEDDIETTIHYLLHWPNCLDERRALLYNLQSIAENMIKKISKSQNVFYLSFLQIMIHQIHATIQYILATKRFDVPLTSSWVVRKIRNFECTCQHYRLQQ